MYSARRSEKSQRDSSESRSSMSVSICPSFGRYPSTRRFGGDHCRGDCRCIAVSAMEGVPRGLVDSLYDSPAIVYVKGPDGRYRHVNQRYQEFFGVAEAEVLGRRDDELAPVATIDGPRVAAASVLDNEPLQLEYTVAPFEGRPALAVWRFAVGAPGEEAVAACAVAAPVGEAKVAREECGRLMALAQSVNGASEPGEENGRIAALHEASALAARRAHEMLNELVGERELREQAEERAAQAQRRISELERALALVASEPPVPADNEGDQLRRRMEEAEAAVAAERARAEESAAVARKLREVHDQQVAEFQAQLDATRAELQSVPAEMASERDRRLQAEAAVDTERTRAEHAESGVAAERARAEEAEAGERELRVDAEDRLVAAEARTRELEIVLAAAETREDDGAGPSWDPGAQRALTAALAQASDWREGVKAAIGVLGTSGGWDAICVWRLEDRHPWVSCFAMWTADQHRLKEFETATWQ